jgi:asparagine synthase (glutamine-hydrolysing)
MESLSVVHSWLDLPGISLRHPFLDVPLMEFCLRLPFALRTNALRAKPLLRMAMKGTVPDVVLNRATKGGLLDPRLCWAFRHERHALTRLLSASMLADLGCIEPARLAEALDDSGSGLDASPSHLYAALALETWLQVKSGRCIVDSRCHEEKERVNARENVSETLQASRDS